MNKPEHTPGPWRFDGSEIRTPLGQLRTTGLALVCGAGDKTEEEANAQLIAAAPEMLEALEDLLPEIQCQCGEAYLLRDMHHPNSLCHRVARVEAAIAKATETPKP